MNSEKKRKREENWEAMFLRLEERLRADGKEAYANLPERDEELARWVDAQRSARESGNLARDKQDRLSGLSFPWESTAESGAARPVKSAAEIEAMQPRRNPSRHIPLGRRMRMRREAEAEAVKLPSADELLENLWERRLTVLEESRRELPAPIRELDSWMYESHEHGPWLRAQRKTWSNLTLPDRLARRLREIKVEPAAHDGEERRRRQWERNALALLDLHERSELRGAEFFDAIEDEVLAKWLRRQSRRAYRGDIRGDERRFLDSLGFPWRPEQWKPKSASKPRRREVSTEPSLSAYRRSLWWPKFVEILEEAWAALPEPIRANVDTWRYDEVDNDLFQRRLAQLRRERKGGRSDPETEEVWKTYRLAPTVSRRRTLFEQNVLKVARTWEGMEEYKRGRDFVSLIPDKAARAWARGQPSHFRAGRLEADQIRLLKAISVPLEFTRGKRRGKVWWDMFGELEAAKREFGGFGYPPDHPRHDAIERWKVVQRNARRRGILDPERENRLDSIGFRWDGWAEVEDRWEASFAKLVAFKERFGHTDVPPDWKEDPRFAEWVAKQREGLSRPPMPRDRSKRLRRLGLQPVERPPAITKRWLDSLKALREHLREDHGTDKLVPEKELDKVCRGFVANQRRRRRAGRLSEEEIRLLDEIGMDWNPPRQALPPQGPKPITKFWFQRYGELKALVAKHGIGVLIESRKAPEYLQLFARDQRALRRRGKLLEEKIRLLDEIGFDWNPRESVRPAWLRRYEQLKRFKKEHGTADVPRTYPPDQALAEFVAQERQRAKKGLLKPAQIKLLKEIGFRFKTTPNRFKKGEDPRKKRRTTRDQ